MLNVRVVISPSHTGDVAPIVPLGVGLTDTVTNPGTEIVPQPLLSVIETMK
jgi:hypothetical protein